MSPVLIFIIKNNTTWCTEIKFAKYLKNCFLLEFQNAMVLLNCWHGLWCNEKWRDEKLLLANCGFGPVSAGVAGSGRTHQPGGPHPRAGANRDQFHSL